jgi:hypothetical protein
LGNGELASLAYGSLKELLQIKELLHIEVMVLRIGSTVFCQFWAIRCVYFSVSGRWGPVLRGFSTPFGRWFSCILDPALTCLFGPHFQLFVLGSVFHYPGHAALLLLDPDFMVRRRRGEGECPRGEDRLGCDREAVDPESIRVERTPPTPQADIESRSTAKRSTWIRVGAVGSVCVRETQRLSLTLEISAGSPANPANT